MGIQVKDIQLVHRIVGSKHVFTSPDVPELNVAHADEAIAMTNIQSAIELVERTRARVAHLTRD